MTKHLYSIVTNNKVDFTVVQHWESDLPTDCLVVETHDNYKYAQYICDGYNAGKLTLKEQSLFQVT